MSVLGCKINYGVIKELIENHGTTEEDLNNIKDDIILCIQSSVDNSKLAYNSGYDLSDDDIEEIRKVMSLCYYLNDRKPLRESIVNLLSNKSISQQKLNNILKILKEDEE